MLRLFLASMLALAACKEANPDFCKSPANADDPQCKTDAAPMKCTNRDMCTDPGMPACDLTDNGGTCVACTDSDPGACKGATPICADRACVACSTDDQCNGVCLSSGACAASDAIIRVVATGGSTMVGCGMASNAPCTLAQGFAEVSTTRNVLKLMPATYDITGATIVLGSQLITIDARGSTLNRTDSGHEVLVIDGANADVTILGGTFQRSTGADDLRVGNDGNLTMYDATVQASSDSGIGCSSGTATLVRSLIRMNGKEGVDFSGTHTFTASQSTFDGNVGGGVRIGNGSKFVIVGNAFFDNGAPGSAVGGVNIQTIDDPNNRFDFNSISQNRAQPGIGAGVNCLAGGVGFTAKNNIAWDDGAAGNITEVLGNCLWSYSDIGPTALPGGLGTTGNMNVDPMFQNEAAGNLHIKPESPVRHMADPASDISGIAAMDIDGQPRTNRADMGVDQVP